MATQEQLNAMRLYAALMEEIKLRLSATFACIQKQPFPSHLVQEFCYLQLRMIAELIALGCLVAHGDIEATKSPKLQKEWSADRILKALEDLHPDFYPRPYTQSLQAAPARKFHLTPIKTGFITQTELVALIRKCGDNLHRGTMKRILTPKAPLQLHFPDLVTTLKKIDRLLSFHMMRLFGSGTLFICGLRNVDDQGRVQVALAGPLPEVL